MVINQFPDHKKLAMNFCQDKIRTTQIKSILINGRDCNYRFNGLLPHTWKCCISTFS